LGWSFSGAFFNRQGHIPFKKYAYPLVINYFEVNPSFNVMTTPHENKQIVLKYIEAFNQCDLATLQSLFTPDALIQGVLGWGELNQVMPIWQELHDAFALELTVEEMIAEGDTVAVRYTERGTFRGPFRGQEPTGKPFELVAMEWFTVMNGRIHRRWGARDSASQARQMEMKLG
jgi:steroid delta-isomerase-like uncharacterized protein